MVPGVYGIRQGSQEGLQLIYMLRGRGQWSKVLKRARGGGLMAGGGRACAGVKAWGSPRLQIVGLRPQEGLAQLPAAPLSLCVTLRGGAASAQSPGNVVKVPRT